MYSCVRNAITLAGLVVLFGLTVPASTLAQDTQQNESDLEFIKRMTTRLQRTENEAGRLEDAIKQMSRQEAEAGVMNQGSYGRQDPVSAQNRESDLRRAEMKMRSTETRARKEREKLVELQRSGSSIDVKDRERIESKVSRLERDITNTQRDLERRRF
jgi:capsule polysaccharide export protein KpsE/RkpR